MNSGGGSDPVIGKAYGEKIKLSDLKRSQYYWNQLARGIYTQDQRPLALTLGEGAYAEINERPELFLLLVRERGWSADRWEGWAYETLRSQLCVD